MFILRLVVDLRVEESNTVDDLFETLADWEEQLKHSDFSKLELEP